MSSGYKCYNCGKGIMVGHNVSHAKNRTRKIFKPNLHGARVVVDGTSMKVRLCTKCLRDLKGRSTRQLKKQKAESKNEIQDKQNSDASSTAPTYA